MRLRGRGGRGGGIKEKIHSRITTNTSAILQQDHIPTTIIWLLNKGQIKTKTREKTKKEKSIGIIMFWRRKKEGKTEEEKKDQETRPAEKRRN